MGIFVNVMLCKSPKNLFVALQATSTLVMDTSQILIGSCPTQIACTQPVEHVLLPIQELLLTFPWGVNGSNRILCQPKLLWQKMSFGAQGLINQDSLRICQHFISQGGNGNYFDRWCWPLKNSHYVLSSYRFS